jgi:hypothetical protein
MTQSGSAGGLGAQHHRLAGQRAFPFWSQSNSRPMVLSSFAMYPSSDIEAIAMTLPMTCSFDSESVLPRRPVGWRKVIAPPTPSGS